jgi:hypothetical protein
LWIYQGTFYDHFLPYATSFLGILLPLPTSVAHLSASGPRFSHNELKARSSPPSHGSAITFFAVALIQIWEWQATQGRPCPPTFRHTLVRPHPRPFRPMTAVSCGRGARVLRGHHRDALASICLSASSVNSGDPVSASRGAHRPAAKSALDLTGTCQQRYTNRVWSGDIELVIRP